MPKYKLTEHAKEEIIRRQISLNMMEEVITNPQSIVPATNNRKCYQKVYTLENQKKYLIRIITEEKRGQLLIVTGYKTSKIGKYIKEESWKLPIIQN